MHAHKLKVTIPKDHRIELRLPEAQERVLANLEELQPVRLTKEEEDVLDQFERFRSEHPLHLSSLTDQD